MGWEHQRVKEVNATHILQKLEYDVPASSQIGSSRESCGENPLEMFSNVCKLRLHVAVDDHLWPWRITQRSTQQVLSKAIRLVLKVLSAPLDALVHF